MMSEAIPQFGEQRGDVTYVDRPGIYAVIQDERGRIAVVTAGEGYFLPGGGIAAGESEAQAMSREALEECGNDARILRPIGRADQRCTTRSGRFFNKRCTYVEAEFGPGPFSAPTEPEHVLLWLDPAAALEHLTLESDVWALQQVLRNRQ